MLSCAATLIRQKNMAFEKTKSMSYISRKTEKSQTNNLGEVMKKLSKTVM